MARVTLIPDSDPQAQSPLAQRIRGARRGRLINLYRVLLHSPDLAQSWLDHLNAVRWKTTLSGRLRELVILRIAWLCQTDYIIRQHVPQLALREGLTEADCAALMTEQPADVFSPEERAALAYTDEVTRAVRACDTTFAALRAHFDERAVVELTTLIGTYNMHVRLVRGLDVDLELRSGDAVMPQPGAESELSKKVQTQ